MTSTLEELVSDALYFRRPNPDASCLQTNMAGQELKRQSADALPIIEQVLRNVVCPRLAESGDHQFNGLSDLLGAYMLIGSAQDAARAVDFLRNVPATLQAKAIALVPVFFQKAKFRPQEKETNDVKMPPDEQILGFIRESSHSIDQAVQENAVWAISFFDS